MFNMITFQPILAITPDTTRFSGIGPYSRYHGSEPEAHKAYFYSVMDVPTLSELGYSYLGKHNRNRMRLNTTRFRTWFHTSKNRYSPR